MLNKSRRRRRRGGKRKKVRSLSWATTINTEPLIYWWDCYFFFFFFSSYFPHHVSTTKFVEYIPLISLDEQNLRKLQFTKWKTKNAPNQCSRLGKQKTERANPIHVNGFIVTTFFSLFLSLLTEDSFTIFILVQHLNALNASCIFPSFDICIVNKLPEIIFILE